MPDKINDIVIVAGPGHYSWKHAPIEETRKGFEKNGYNVHVIGDGNRDITLQEIHDKVQSILKTGKSIDTVFHITHGKNEEDGTLGLRLNGEEGDAKTRTPVTEYFSTLKNAFGENPVNMFMVSCHGGIAHSHADLLPVGSSIVTLGSENDSVEVKSFRGLAIVLGQHNFETNLTPMSLLGVYQGFSLSADKHDMPMITLSDGTQLNTQDILLGVIGEKIPESTTKTLHDNLDSFWGKSRVDGWISRIENTKSLNDLSIYDTGPASLIALMTQANIQQTQLPSINYEEIAFSGLPSSPNSKDWVSFAEPPNVTQAKNGDYNIHVVLTDGQRMQFQIPHYDHISSTEHNYKEDFLSYSPQTGQITDYDFKHGGVRNGQNVFMGEIEYLQNDAYVTGSIDYVQNYKFDISLGSRYDIYSVYGELPKMPADTNMQLQEVSRNNTSYPYHPVIDANNLISKAIEAKLLPDQINLSAEDSIMPTTTLKK